MTRRRLGGFARGIALALVIGFFLLPMVVLALTSVKTKDDVLSGNFLPAAYHWENWPDAFGRVPIAQFIGNSMLAAAGGTLLTLLLAVPATYAMVRYRTGGKALYSLVLSSYTAPPVVALLPIFFALRFANLIDSVAGLAIVYGLMNVPAAVWLLDSFVRGVPREIEEAAWVDGASRLGALVRMVLPLIMPGIAAAAVICAILCYNELLFALTFTYGPRSQTLPVGLALFQGDRLVNYGQIAAASLTGIVPVYLLALVGQRWLVGGLTHGAVK
ncbi:MAG: carbohydrate ABC transporter permease [Chloroflexota bacterium]